VPLFAKKAPCPWCGRDVRETADPGDYLCPHCGRPGPWASPDQSASWTRRQDARARYRDVVNQMVNTSDVRARASRLDLILQEAGLQGGDVMDIKMDAFSASVLAATQDDILTPEENDQLDSLRRTLGLDWQILAPDLAKKISVASINGGILPEIVEPRLLPKKDEVVHLEGPATLLKEVAVRQYVGGYQGLSIPIGKTGLRYRVGATKGHSVQVGTQLQVADTGVLAVTNRRVVYMGTRKTIEMAYSKLVNITVYDDGIQFHVSNRVNAPLFRIENEVDIVAAVVNAAAQRVDA
jgi:hypothetical protein